MGSTFFSLHYHIVFSTKERRPFIKPEWQPRLHAYLAGIIKGMHGVPEIVGGVEDHVHILASLRPVAPLRGAEITNDLSGGLRGLRPPATFWQPFGLRNEIGVTPTIFAILLECADLSAL